MDIKNVQQINGMILDETKNRLTTALAMRGLKPVDLANMTGIPKSSISQYMSGYAVPKQDRIHIIAKALNVSEAWLIGFPVTPTENNISSDSFTNEDRLLIGMFQKLSERDRKIIVNMAQFLLDSH